MLQAVTATPPNTDKTDKPDLSRKRRWFRAFEQNKRSEIEEAREARKYYNDKQWTDEEISRLKKRGQQATVRNRIKRKIDFLVGTEQRLRRDPKAYPRTPQHDQEANTATAALRFVCDVNRWEAIASNVMHDGLVSGVGIAFIGIDGEDPKFDHVMVDRWFYDPRSVRPDFSDARFLGLHLWFDIDEAKERWEEHGDALEQILDTGRGGLTSLEHDRETSWGDFENRRVRVIEFWEKKSLAPHMAGYGWQYCFFTGDVYLEGGWSPYKGLKDEPDCPYEAWSPYLDEKGDRYGLVRTLKSVQDEVNHSASKMLWRLSTRQFFYNEASVSDPDAFSIQIARPDGKIKLNPGTEWGKDVGVVEDARSLQGEAERHQLAIQEMENYGPNPGLVGQGQGVDGASGRALLAQRDSGMTELSPVFERHRDWKLRCYRKMWARIRQSWTGERWIRVTDDQRSLQFIGLNQYGMDPETGQISAQNVVAQIDVDIILDEGPDTITMNEELMEKLGQLGEAATGPVGQLMIELSNTANKEVLLKRIEEWKQQQGPPPELMIKQAEHEGKMAELQTKSQLDQQLASANIELKQKDIQLKELDIIAKQYELRAETDLKAREMDAEERRQGMEERKHLMQIEHLDRKQSHDMERLKREDELRDREAERAEAADIRKAEISGGNTPSGAKKASQLATKDDLATILKVLVAPRELETDQRTGRKRSRIVLDELEGR